MADPSQAQVPTALKAAVIVMGALLVVGFAVLVVTIAVRSNRLAANTGGDSEVSQPPAAAAFATAIDLSGPAEIQEITAGGGVILIHLTDDNGRKIIVINAETGARQGVITLGNTP